MQKWWFGNTTVEGWDGWDVGLLDDNGRVVSFYGLVQGMHSHQK